MGDNRLSTKRLRFVFVALISLVYFGVLCEEESSSYVFVSTETNQQACPPNEMYRPCLVDCTNCDFRGYCPMNCSNSGCDCIGNFYRLEPDGPCEPVAKCPAFECGENEVFRHCGPMCERCNTLLCRIVTCENRCYCKEGYLRNYNWTCVPQDQCPPRMGCADNEEIADSGKIQEYCLYADTTIVTNDTQEKTDCYCKEGYKRNGLGYCIDESYCSYVHCVENEVYNECPNKCNTTCRNYGDTDCEEDGQCYPGCFCKEGLVMDDYRNCVPIDKCPPGSNPYAPTAAPPSEEDTTESVTDTTTETSDATAEADASTVEADAETTEATPGTTEADIEETTADEETTVEEEATTETPPVPKKLTKPPKPTKGKIKPSKTSQKSSASSSASAEEENN